MNKLQKAKGLNKVGRIIGGDRSPDWLVEERIAEMSAILASNPGIHRCEIRKLLRKRKNWMSPKTGEPIHWMTMDIYAKRAREALTQRSKRPRDAWIDDLLSGYSMDIADKDPKVRLAARQGIRDLLGLDAPKRTELTGAEGATLPAMIVQVVGVSGEPVRHVVEVSDTPVEKELTAGETLEGSDEQASQS